MLTITAEQFEALEEAQFAGLAALMAPFLRREMPDLVRSFRDFELAQFCVETAHLCRDYGLQSAHDIVWFVAVRLAVHRDFHQHPNIQQALRSLADAPGSRIETLLQMTDPLDWAEAEHQGNS